MRKNFSKALIAFVIISFLIPNSVFAKNSILIGDIDANNKIKLTFTTDKTDNSDRYGLVTVYRKEMNTGDLKNNLVSKQDVLFTSPVIMPAKASGAVCAINMSGESTGTYYAHFQLGGEVVIRSFSYMDFSSLNIFLAEFNAVTDAENLYSFFVAHSDELNLNLADYPYTADEIKFVLANMVNINYTSLTVIKEDFGRNFILVDINKADAAGVKAILEANYADIGLDMNSKYNGFTDSEKNKIVEKLDAAVFNSFNELIERFNLEVKNLLQSKLLEKIKESTTDNIISIITDSENAAILEINVANSLYSKYIPDNTSAGAKFAGMLQGADCSSAAEFKTLFDNSVILSAVKGYTDYAVYVDIINDLKTPLNLSGDYFSWTITEAKYEVNKLMINSSPDINTLTDIVTKFNEHVSYVKTNILPDLVSGSGSKTAAKSGGGGGGGSTVTLGNTPVLTPLLPEAVKTGSFDDLWGYEWAEESIEGLKELGVIDGVSERLFEPGRLIKREEFIKLLTLAFGFEIINGDSGFTDVSTSDWFSPYVKTLTKLEIINGVGESKFGVGQEITREDMCTILYRVIEYTQKQIPHVSDSISFIDDEFIAGYASEAVYALQTGGIVSGMDDNMFEPKTPTNRAMAAKVIAKLMAVIIND